MQRSFLIVTLLALSATAGAEQFDYNYFFIGYGNLEFDDIDVDGDGFGIGGSYAISGDFHVFADYTAADLDFDVDASSWSAGVGYNTSVSPVVDLVASVSYEYVELDAPIVGSVDDSGLGLGLGMRFAATEVLELNAGISYVDLSDSGDETTFALGGLYHFTDAFALGLGGSWGDDSSSYSISGRFYFDR